MLVFFLIFSFTANTQLYKDFFCSDTKSETFFVKEITHQYGELYGTNIVYNLSAAAITKSSNFYVSVKDTPYNAIGNGIADDVIAIQAALNSIPSSGGVVIFPPGSYRVTKALTVKDSVTITGYGATLKNTGTAHFQMLGIEGSTGNHKTDVLIFGLTIDANGTILDINASGIAAAFCERIRIKDVTVLNAWGSGILIGRSAKDVWIEKCVVNKAWGDGIHIGDQYSGEIIERIWVTNCDIIRSYDGGLAATAGVHDFWFLNNKIDITTIGPGIDLSGGYNGVIEGNTMHSYAQIGIRVQAFGGDAYNLIIQRNTIGKPAKGQYCITMLAPNIVDSTKPIFIKDNFLFGGTAGEGCLFLNGTNYVRIEGNYFEHNLTGIKLDGLVASPNNYVMVINNTFKNMPHPFNIGVASVNPNLIRRWNKYINSPNEDDK